MKNILYFIISIFLFTACKTDKNAIEFKKVNNIDLGNLSKENATMNATVVFINNSDKEFKLKDIVIDFIVDGKDIGTIVTKSNKLIKANDEFSVPIKYTYNTSSFVAKDHEPLGKYELKLTGDLTVLDGNNEEITISINHTSTYEYQTKKEIRVEKRETKKEERQKRREERKEKRNN